MNRVSEFDKTYEFQKKIKPIIDELIKQAKVYEIDLFVNVCVSSEKEKTTYRNFHVSTAVNMHELYDDQIRKHVLIANGFEAVPPTANAEIPMDDYTLSFEEA